MKIFDAFRDLVDNPLTEGKRDYGCVMLYFTVPKEFWDNIQSRISDDEVSSETDEDGKELKGRAPIDEAHVTLLYGIHEDVPDEDVEEIINQIDTIEVTLKNVSSFENDGFDVLKFDVEGSDLFEYNKKLSELPHTTNFPDYHPHLTIAYLKKDVLTDEMQENLSKDEALTVEADKVVYSKPDGSSKEYKLK